MKTLQSILTAMGTLALWITISFWIYLPSVAFRQGLEGLWDDYRAMTAFTVVFTIAGAAGALFERRNR